jgi:hypothetical protein
MKQFLGAWRDDQEDLHVGLFDEADEPLRRDAGRTSPLYPAVADGPPASLNQDGAIAFLVPTSPTRLLARLTNDFGREVAEKTFITHGHAAAVLICDSSEEAKELIAQVEPDLGGHEIWPFTDSRVQLQNIETSRPAPNEQASAPDTIDPNGLGYEAAAQIRQFNANLVALCGIATRYAPELGDLVQWLHTSTSDLRDQLAVCSADLANDRSVRASIGIEGLVVEMNAVLTLYCSQVGSGVLPLHRGTFPVGEYSLLGIGGMVRAAWRLYFHMNRIFAEFDHVGLLQRHYERTAPFNPFAPAARIDYSAWSASPASVASLADGESEGFRVHMPYFSSRWGFHESMYAISLSWQCLYASASKEWNLLTLTHEFLHAHVRDLLGCVLDIHNDDANVLRILEQHHERQLGDNALQSMQIAYVEALVGIRGAGRLASHITDRNAILDAEIPDDLTPDLLIDLVRAHSGLIHEIIVHVLDYQYVYDARDEDYVTSIWSSWSVVPGVVERIDHYVLRTLCALSSSPQTETEPVFADALARLRTALETLTTTARIRPAVVKALDLLQSEAGRKRLSVEFVAARYVVEMAMSFFFDDRLNARLVRDDLTTIRDGKRAYEVSSGDYRGEMIESPVAFLLDRFESYPDHPAGEESEYVSIWQMLMLT